MTNETSTDLFLVMNFIAVKTGGTWKKFKRSEGQKIISEVGCGHKKNEKIFPSLMLGGGPTGTRTKSMFGYSGEKHLKWNR
jgi:hypothetical protein